MSILVRDEARSSLVRALAFGVLFAFGPVCAGGAVRSTAFADLPQERLEPTRWESGDTTISNEARLDLFRPALERARGGIYVGVGGLQNFTLAAWARSERIFLMDFTRTVVIANRVQVAFLKAAATGQEFRALWSTAGRDRALALIAEEIDPADAATARKVYLWATPFVRRYFARMDRVREAYEYAVFYDDPEAYAYIRGLALDGRILPLEGNLIGATTLRGLGSAARKAGVKVRVLYLSNAEEYFPFRPYPNDFIENVLNLPVDGFSVAIRTVSLHKGRWPWAPGSRLLTTRGFHYGVQSLELFQAWLRGTRAPGGTTGRYARTDVLKMFAAGTRGRPLGLTRLDAPPPDAGR